jgi:hypothetical protein
MALFTFALSTAIDFIISKYKAQAFQTTLHEKITHSTFSEMDINNDAQISKVS